MTPFCMQLIHFCVFFSDWDYHSRIPLPGIFQSASDSLLGKNQASPH